MTGVDSTNGLNITVQKSHRMYTFDGSEYLHAQSKRSRQAKSGSGLRPSQLCQITTLQLHHYVVESVVSTTANKSTIKGRKPLISSQGNKSTLIENHPRFRLNARQTAIKTVQPRSEESKFSKTDLVQPIHF